MRDFINIVTEAGHTPDRHEAEDQEHYDALDRTGFFGAQGAGAILMAKTTGRIMLVLRSPEVEQPGTYGSCGGAFNVNNETPIQAAKREIYEETGYNKDLEMIPLYIFQKGTFKYFNFLGLVDDEFVPELGWEATSYKWCILGDYPSPLHFGITAILNDDRALKILQHYSSLFNGNRVQDHPL